MKKGIIIFGSLVVTLFAFSLIQARTIPRDELFVDALVDELVPDVLEELLGGGFRTQRGPQINPSPDGGGIFTGGTVTNTIFVTNGVNTTSMGVNEIVVGGPSGSSSLQGNFLIINTSTGFASGTFNVASNGSIMSSGTVFDMNADNAIVSSSHARHEYASVPNTLYVKTVTNPDTNGDLSISVNGTGLVIFSTGMRASDNVEMRLGTTAGATQSMLTFSTAQSPSSPTFELGTGHRFITFMENGDQATNMGTPQQTDPTIVMVPGVAIASDNRKLLISQGVASSTIRNLHGPLHFNPASSTVFYPLPSRLEGALAVRTDGSLSTSGTTSTFFGALVVSSTIADNGGVSVSTSGNIYMQQLAITGGGTGVDALCVDNAGADAGLLMRNATLQTCAVSSRRFKHDIEDLDVGLPLLLKLRPVQFKSNDTDEPRIGLIAEEVNELEPRLVGRDADGTPRGVHYEDATALLIKSIQEQQGQIDTLKNGGRNAAVFGFLAGLIGALLGNLFLRKRV